LLHFWKGDPLAASSGSLHHLPGIHLAAKGGVEEDQLCHAKRRERVEILEDPSASFPPILGREGISQGPHLLAETAFRFDDGKTYPHGSASIFVEAKVGESPQQKWKREEMRELEDQNGGVKEKENPHRMPCEGCLFEPGNPGGHPASILGFPA